ncbi:MAG TPA: hypothetical protein VGP07_12705 [Polyangia bacterium]|jgi:hypothetical protein
MALAATPAPPLAAAAAPSLPVARVAGQPIAASALAEHQAATGLGRTDALDDLVDLTLLRSAAIQQRLPVAAGALTSDARAELERALADRLNVGVPAGAPAATVHAAVRTRLLEGKIVEILDIPSLR